MNVMEKTAESAVAGAREYLTFRLDQEEYGIDILKVQEIRGYEPPTRIANAPAFIKGVTNLRGTIVPIVDMRLKFNCSPPTPRCAWRLRAPCKKAQCLHS